MIDLRLKTGKYNDIWNLRDIIKSATINVWGKVQIIQIQDDGIGIINDITISEASVEVLITAELKNNFNIKNDSELHFVLQNIELEKREIEIVPVNTHNTRTTLLIHKNTTLPSILPWYMEYWERESDKHIGKFILRDTAVKIDTLELDFSFDSPISYDLEKGKIFLYDDNWNVLWVNYGYNEKVGENNIFLVLSSYEPVNWKITDPKGLVKGVIVSGYHKWNISGIDSKIPVEYTDLKENKNKKYFYAYKQNSSEFKKMETVVKNTLKTSWPQYGWAYTVKKFIVSYDDVQTPK
jgi:hypothetical protein